MSWRPDLETPCSTFPDELSHRAAPDFIEFAEHGLPEAFTLTGQRRRNLCFNIAGSAGDKPSLTELRCAGSWTASGYRNLIATPQPRARPNFAAASASDCTVAHRKRRSALRLREPGELDVPCTADADCTVDGVQTGSCDVGGTDLCDTAGTCEVAVVDNPNAGEICFTKP